MKKKLLIVLAALAVVTILYYGLKTPLLKLAGSYLIYENELEKADALFVLGGNAYNRGNEAVKVYQQGLTDQIICTGGNTHQLVKSLGLDYMESELAKINIVRQGVPDSLVFIITDGTSTFEEADHILDYCKENNIESCIILSSKFHTKRIKKVFKKKFEKEGIKIMIHGAASYNYDETLWWHEEEGMIAVNNEYIKHLYYWFFR
ncbi:MAG: YdcF family protein [Bacteroidetes bacterium]|nr:YdcF family protein [Bacteroidota bacterium]